MDRQGILLVSMSTGQSELVCASLDGSDSVSVFKIGQRGAPITVVKMPADVHITSLLALYVKASEDWKGN